MNALLQEYQTATAGRRKAIEAAIVRGQDLLKIVKAIARGYRGLGDLDDLVQVAMIGLLKAIRTYNPELGAFEPRARLCIHEALRNARTRLATVGDVELSEFEAASSFDVEDVLDKKRILEGLTDFDRVIVTMRANGASFQAIGRHLGVDASTACRTLKKATASIGSRPETPKDREKEGPVTRQDCAGPSKRCGGAA